MGLGADPKVRRRIGAGRRATRGVFRPNIEGIPGKRDLDVPFRRARNSVAGSRSLLQPLPSNALTNLGSIARNIRRRSRRKFLNGGRDTLRIRDNPRKAQPGQFAVIICLEPLPYGTPSERGASSRDAAKDAPRSVKRQDP